MSSLRFQLCSNVHMEGMMIRGRTIGRGATATVSLAVSPSGHVSAVKSAELSVSAVLQRERQILSRLNSRRVVKYLGYSISRESGKLFYNVFTEFVSGGSLYDLIRRQGGWIEEPMIRSWVKDILLGLDYLHSNFIVHCDIKSRNILIGEDGAKIADLGCSKRAGDSCDLGITGTPIFMSPEAARGEEQSFPADVWALGCTVIEMATGLFNPWPELNDPVSALYRIGHTDDFPEYPSFLSDDGRDFLRRCLERDSGDRWTAKQLLRHPFVNNLGNTAKPTGSSSPFSVLDQGFWDSSVSSEANRNAVNLLSSSQSPPLETPADRIRNLACAGVVADQDWKDWSCDENNWISVRLLSSEENCAAESAYPASTETELLTSSDPSSSSSSFDFNYWRDFVFSNFKNKSPYSLMAVKDPILLNSFNLLHLVFPITKLNEKIFFTRISTNMNKNDYLSIYHLSM